MRIVPKKLPPPEICSFGVGDGGGWGGGDGGAVSWGVGAVDGGSVNAFLAAVLTRVMRAAVPLPAVALCCNLLLLVDLS